jgi:hypothetical protein
MHLTFHLELNFLLGQDHPRFHKVETILNLAYHRNLFHNYVQSILKKPVKMKYFDLFSALLTRKKNSLQLISSTLDADGQIFRLESGIFHLVVPIIHFHI